MPSDNAGDRFEPALTVKSIIRQAAEVTHSVALTFRYYGNSRSLRATEHEIIAKKLLFGLDQLSGEASYYPTKLRTLL